MRKIGLFFILLMWVLNASADHITGGETYYTLISSTNGQYRYRITVKLFMDCFSNRQFSNPGIIGIFHKASGSRYTDISVPLANQETLTLTDAGPCITNPPPVCYRVGYYEFEATLPASPEGYIITTQVNYRINGISNLTNGYSNVGATYTGEIPGTSAHPDGPNNSSARFTGNDMVVVCANNSFSYSFAASDPNSDDLVYSFCEAYMGGSIGGGGNATPPNPPPYNAVPYGNGFNGSSPLGGNVHIDATTGMITGIAPSEGTYVVTVCVQEIRGNKVIAVQRKDLQIKIASCNIAAASLPPAYMLCDSTQTVSLANNSNSPLINSYNWEILNPAGATIFSSVNATASYTFADTGTYQVKLVINRNGQCADSSISVVRVYPGFIPAFSFTGICVNKPTQFRDGTTTVFGQVSGWRWDFGQPFDPANNNSSAQHPTYTYTNLGTKQVRLIVTNTNGCMDTLIKPVPIVDKPPITLAFRDTLICVPDAVQLKAEGGGSFSWSPNSNIVNANTPTPTVNPITTTHYVVTLNDHGCVNRDSVQVRVVDHVTLQVMDDTIICQADAIQLLLTSDGLRYAWTPEEQILNPFVANPTATTPATTVYEVTAHIGSCSARGDVLVTTVPYPVSIAGPDIMICHEASVQLNGGTDGKTVEWRPAASLSNPNIINPIAHPRSTTNYILASYDTKGCPKAGLDSILVTVMPDIIASAGRDTAAVVGQPLQLRASGGVRYNWLPGEGLSATDIPNPIAVFYNPSYAVRYKVLVFNEADCVDSAFLNIKVFKTRPSIFVPTAFSPNGDRNNDVFRFIAAGMQTIEYFNVYNRWGQMVYSSTNSGSGWDGTTGGKPQSAGIYVWTVKAMDYTGAVYTQRGTVTLVR